MHGKLVPYNEFVVLGQIIPLHHGVLGDSILERRNINEDNHLVDMVVPLYSIDDKFIGLGKTIGYIILRGNLDETFWSFGTLDSRQKIPNIFTSAAFNFDYTKALRKNLSKNILLIPTTTGQKFAPVKCKTEKVDALNVFAPKDYCFDPTHLISYDYEVSTNNPIDFSTMSSARKTLYNYLKSFVQESNANLEKNAFDLLQSKELPMHEFHWLTDISKVEIPLRITKTIRKKWKFTPEDYAVS